MFKTKMGILFLVCNVMNVYAQTPAQQVTIPELSPADVTRQTTPHSPVYPPQQSTIPTQVKGVTQTVPAQQPTVMIPSRVLNGAPSPASTMSTPQPAVLNPTVASPTQVPRTPQSGQQNLQPGVNPPAQTIQRPQMLPNGKSLQ